MCLQEQEQRLQEVKQRLEVQQADLAAASSRPSSALQPPLASEPSEGAISLSAPVTMNDRQHRTAAALLSSLGQTANRGRERLGRLERVLNTIAADAAEPEKVRCFTCSDLLLANIPQAVLVVISAVWSLL